MNKNDCFYHIYINREKIVTIIKYLIKNYRIDNCFLNIVAPVYQKFETRELENYRVTGRLIKTRYLEQKNILIIFIEIKQFKKRIISVETI